MAIIQTINSPQRGGGGSILCEVESTVVLHAQPPNCILGGPGG